MSDINQLLSSSHKTLEELQKKLGELDKVHQDIIELKDAAIKGHESIYKIPQEFERKFNDIKVLSEKYLTDIGIATKTYFDGNNNLFTTKLKELSIKIKEFEKEITRLLNTDFTKLFKALQKVFIDQTRNDLEVELKKIETKSNDLQTKIDELKKQRVRLENIDLEKHFDKLQKTLSDIFGAVNSINLTLTSITQNLNNIAQSLGAIQVAIDKNHKESKQLINSFSDASEKHLTDQDKQAKNNFELLESKMKSLSEQNELLKNEIKINKIVQFIGLGLTLIILIYIIYKH